MDASRGAPLAICYFCSLCCTRLVFCFCFAPYQQCGGGGWGLRCQTCVFVVFFPFNRPQAGLAIVYKTNSFSGWQPMLYAECEKNNICLRFSLSFSLRMLHTFGGFSTLAFTLVLASFSVNSFHQACLSLIACSTSVCPKARSWSRFTSWVES